MEIKNLRHKFLHFSSSYGGANQPQFIEQRKKKDNTDMVKNILIIFTLLISIYCLDYSFYRKKYHVKIRMAAN